MIIYDICPILKYNLGEIWLVGFMQELESFIYIS